MDAIHFINEVNRMCKSHDDVCTGCPLMHSNCLVNDFDVEAEKVVPIVEKWSEEHPLVTNGMKVMELIPDNSRLTNDTGEDNVQMVIARGWWDAPYKGE